jgi:uncharacterized membrane protein YfcA
VSVALALAALIGLSLGLLGGGGSTLAVPVLVYVAGLDARSAVGVSLAVVGATSLVAALAQARAGRVRARAALLFAGAGMPAAWAGSSLTALVSGRALLLAFGAFMVAVALVMLRPQAAPDESSSRRPARAAVVAGAGALVGLLTGFLGVGGGFLVVPALVLLARLPMHEAVGTSLAVIAANSAAGFVGHLGGGGLPMGVVVWFTAVSIAGALAGTRLGGRLAPHRLRRVFALLVLAVGAAVVAANLAAPS